MDNTEPFQFYDPGRLVDEELELVLVETAPERAGYVPYYTFDMVHVGKGVRMGTISLRVGYTEYILMYSGQIGYGVRPEFRGHRYAARSCLLIFPLARQHGINPLWITCNPDNWPSRRTCEIVGAEFVEIVKVPENTPLYHRGEITKCRYRVAL